MHDARMYLVHALDLTRTNFFASVLMIFLCFSASFSNAPAVKTLLPPYGKLELWSS